MSEIDSPPPGQGYLNTMVAYYLRNRELGNLTISRILQERVSELIMMEQITKDIMHVLEFDETLQNLSDIFIEIEN